MREFAKAFYRSQAWKDCRAAYAKSVGGLCETCLKAGLYVPGKVVHHRTALTPDNIHDPSVTLNWANLKLVCQDCHAKEHKGPGRYWFDAEGNVHER